jgi:hypothetical protein
MSEPRFVIEVPGGTHAGASIYEHGKPLTDIAAATWSLSPGGVAMLTPTYEGASVEIRSGEPEWIPGVEKAA